MADETKKKTTWVFDIDAEKFKKKVKDVRKKINEVGDPKNLDGLKQGLLQVTAGSIAFIATMKIVKTAMDLAFRADRIKEINKQFNLLTANAGISGEELRRQLNESSNGLISMNELLDITNKSILAMGPSAGKSMPKLVALADKISTSMGGELTERLEQLKSAIESGSAASFEQLGILLDEDKVLRQYAKTMGTTVDVLSDAGRRQAFLNAALETGNKQFASVDSTASKNINTWISLKTAVTEFSDAFVIIFEKTIGPTLQKYLGNLKDWTLYLKKEFVAAAGEGFDAQKLRVQKLTDAVRNLGYETSVLEVEKLKWWENQKTRDTNILVAKSKEKRAIIELAKEQAKLNEMLAKAPKPGAGPVDPSGVDTEKQKARKAKFESELLALSQARVEQEIALNMNIEDADRLHNEQRSLIQQEFQTKLDELEAQEDERLITKGERLRIEAELYAQRTNALIAQDQKLDDIRSQSLDNWVKNSKSAAEGFERAFTAASKKAAMEQKNFSQQATFAVNAFHGNAVNAFLALGEGSKNLGEAMKSFVLGALADIAENHGKLYMLQGFTNPALFGAGAALLALAGLLRAQSGGGASAGGGGGDVGGGAAPAIEAPEETEITPIAEAVEPKKVEINFHGDYLDTAETQQRFVDIIREAGDVQEFTINKID